MIVYHCWMDFEYEAGMTPVYWEFETEEEVQEFFSANYTEDYWVIERV